MESKRRNMQIRLTGVAARLFERSPIRIIPANDPEIALALLVPEAFARASQGQLPTFGVPTALIPQSAPGMAELESEFPMIYTPLKSDDVFWFDLIGQATCSALRTPTAADGAELACYVLEFGKVILTEQVFDFCKHFHFIPINYLELIGLSRTPGAVEPGFLYLGLGGFTMLKLDNDRRFPCVQLDEKGRKSLGALREGKLPERIRFIVRRLSGGPPG